MDHKLVIEAAWNAKAGKMNYPGLEACLVGILGDNTLSTDEKVKLSREALDAFTKRGYFNDQRSIRMLEFSSIRYCSLNSGGQSAITWRCQMYSFWALWRDARGHKHGMSVEASTYGQAWDIAGIFAESRGGYCFYVC